MPAVSCLWVPLAMLGVFPAYRPVQSVLLPDRCQVFDITPDGRIVAVAHDRVYIETALGSGAFSGLGPLPGADMASFGAAFIKVSPDGTRIAVGNNGGASFTNPRVGIFGLPGLSGTWFAADHFDAAWFDDRTLILTAALFGQPAFVSVLDTFSAEPGDPQRPRVIAGIGGASAGVAFDWMGNLITGNGFQVGGPSTTGTIKAFARSEWLGALQSGQPLDFEMDGVMVADVLSASSLGFDGDGNLHVGGGDFLSSDRGYVGLIRASALEGAFAGRGSIPNHDPLWIQHLDARPEVDDDFYAVKFNPITGALCLFAFGTSHLVLFAPLEPIPFAASVADAHPALDGSGAYNDPTSILGPPSRRFFDPLLQRERVVSLISPPVNRKTEEGSKLITSIGQGQFIKVRFDAPIEDDPRNPFGRDFMVFGNSFFVGDDYVTPETNLEEFILDGFVFEEPVTVAVSQTGIGNPLTHPAEWYVYQSGPFADGMLPTQARTWSRTRQTWGELLDFTLPANPELRPADFEGITAADGVALYECSAGGTGFDLAKSGFDSISYVLLTSSGGEVDAIVDVFASLGDFDRDADLDLTDVAALFNCMTAEPGEAGTCHCRPGDLDASRDVSASDLSLFLAFLEGPQP